MDYKARFYSVGLGRFIQPDSIIPSSVNPQSWNRLAYVGNNPIRFSDPTGHKEYDEIGGGIPCYPGELICQLSKADWVSSSDASSDIDIRIDEEDVVNEPSYPWDVVSSIENCNGDWDCINTLLGFYYEDLGYPLDHITTTLPKHNPLGPNELDFMEPSILMEMQRSENTRFLYALNVDPAYPYNYEPAYLAALKERYPNIFEDASNQGNWFSESGTAFHEYIYDPFGGYAWVTKDIHVWERVLQLDVKFPVRYQTLVIGDR